MLVQIHELPLFDVPIRGNVFGIIPLERLPWLRIAHRDSHCTDLMPRLQFGWRLTWWRTFLGQSPDFEGAKRQMRGNVVVERLPAGYAGCSVAIAMRRSSRQLLLVGSVSRRLFWTPYTTRGSSSAGVIVRSSGTISRTSGFHRNLKAVGLARSASYS